MALRDERPYPQARRQLACLLQVATGGLVVLSVGGDLAEEEAGPSLVRLLAVAPGELQRGVRGTLSLAELPRLPIGFAEGPDPQRPVDEGGGTLLELDSFLHERHRLGRAAGGGIRVAQDG